MDALGFCDGFANGIGNHLDGLDGVVVTGDGIIHQLGIAVGVYQCHDRDAQFAGFGDGVAFALDIHYEHCVRRAVHVADAAKVLHEALFFAADGGLLLFHVTGNAAILFHSLDFLEALKALLHGLKVGEHTTQPPVRDKVLFVSLRQLADNWLGLFLRAHEQNLTASANGVAQKITGSLELVDGLREVDNVDSVVCPENVGLHLRIPPTSLVAKMDTCFKQFLNSYAHIVFPCSRPLRAIPQDDGIVLVVLEATAFTRARMLRAMAFSLPYGGKRAGKLSCAKQKATRFLSKMNKKNTIEAVILAGGQSRRMGEDKTRLWVGRRTLLGHARALAADLGLKCRVVRVDRRAGNGPLGGIETALRRARAARILFLSCDMPFLTVALVERLLEVEHSAVFAESEKMAGFPFCLSKRVLPSVEECIEGGELSVQAFASRHGYRVRIPRCDWPQLTNINTPAQLAAARAALK